MQTYQTGDSLIFKVPEREITLQPAALYPAAFPATEADADNQPIALSIHSWVVQTPHDLIVIDTATGNGRERGGNPLYHQLNTPYLENLRAAGVNPEDVSATLPRELIAISSILSLSEKFSMVLRISEEKLMSASWE